MLIISSFYKLNFFPLFKKNILKIGNLPFPQHIVHSCLFYEDKIATNKIIKNDMTDSSWDNL